MSFSIGAKLLSLSLSLSRGMLILLLFLLVAFLKLVLVKRLARDDKMAESCCCYRSTMLQVVRGVMLAIFCCNRFSAARFQRRELWESSRAVVEIHWIHVTVQQLRSRSNKFSARLSKILISCQRSNRASQINCNWTRQWLYNTRYKVYSTLEHYRPPKRKVWKSEMEIKIKIVRDAIENRFDHFAVETIDY